MKTAFQHRPDLLQIRIEMLKKGLTQKAVALELGVSHFAVSNALAGRRIRLLKRVARFVRSYRPRKAA